MEYTILSILWIAWCILHSAMISLRFTSFLKKRLGRGYRYFRLFFNVTAAITLIPPVWYCIHLRRHLLWQWTGFWTLPRWSLLALAAVLFIGGAMKYDLKQFLGIRQILSGQTSNAITESGELDTSGILSITRHPWYLATLIFVWAQSSTVYISTLIVQIILSVYLVVGTVLEERKLIAEHGNVYRDYQKRVPMLFPLKWLSSRLF